MAQRILERGQIDALEQRDIPRLIQPQAGLFGTRAARLQALAPDNAIEGYLRLMARLCEAQQAEFDALPAMRVEAMREAALAQRPAAAAEAGMPPLLASGLVRDPAWRELLRGLCARIAGQGGFPEAVAATLQRLRDADDDALDAQATALLDADAIADDAAAAPFLMAALQLWWTALAGDARLAKVVPMPDAPGLCPVCGTAPVASQVHAQAPYAGHRYLACALCSCQWHYVRVQCSRCGAAGKDIAYQTLAGIDAEEVTARGAGVRAETCEACHGYRKILYEENEPGVEPVADDLATLPLDLLLGERGYARASQNPLLWQAAGD